MGGLFLGPLSASRLSAELAAGSAFAEIVSFLGFALVFFVGTVLWMGLGVASVVLRGLWELARHRRLRREGPEPSQISIPPGYRSYPVVGVVFGIAVGFVVGVVTPLRISVAVPVWSLSGLAYGLLLWGAAHHGYLPFPEPD